MFDPENFMDHNSDAWIDLPTNFTSLPEFSSASDIESLLKHQLPAEKAHAFLHEMTHHWCFDSYVGIALSILKTRIYYGIAALEAGRDYEELDVLDDIVRYQAVTEFLRPVSEGIALFAEHDARPEGLSFYSTPLVQAFHLRRDLLTKAISDGPTLWTSDAISQLAREGLDMFRLEPHGVERKADLLCSDFDTAESPYLSGYLAIKTLWIEQRRKAVHFNNSDAFLSYVRSYFFNDLGMVAAMLCPKHEMGIAESISLHMHSRLTNLFDADTEEAFRSWDSQGDVEIEGNEGTNPIMSLSSTGEVRPEMTFNPTPGLLIETEAAREGHDRLSQLISWLDHRNERSDLFRAIKRVGAIRIGARGLMPVAAIKVKAINNERVVSDCGVEFGPFIFADDQTQLFGTYTLEYFHIPSNKRVKTDQLVVLTRGDSVVGTLKIDDEDEELQSLVRYLKPSAQQLEDIRNLRRFEQDVRASQTMYVTRTILEDYRMEETIAASLRIWIRGMASRFLVGEDWESTLEKYGYAGLFHIFEGDVAFIRKFSEYSLRANHYNQDSTLSKMFNSDVERRNFYSDLVRIEKKWSVKVHWKGQHIEECFL